MLSMDMDINKKRRGRLNSSKKMVSPKPRGSWQIVYISILLIYNHSSVDGRRVRANPTAPGSICAVADAAVAAQFLSAAEQRSLGNGRTNSTDTTGHFGGGRDRESDGGKKQQTIAGTDRRKK
jgi:hypothetical protein